MRSKAKNQINIALAKCSKIVPYMFSAMYLVINILSFEINIFIIFTRLPNNLNLINK